MTNFRDIEEIGNAAVRKLRVQKLLAGLPFMINSDDLEKNQCYLEYPDGSIKLVFLATGAREFTEIRTLSSREELILRHRYDFQRL